MHWLRAFHRPRSLADALRLMRESRGTGRYVAGCTDVLVQQDRQAQVLIDISRVGLSYIKRKAGGWAIGAGTTFRTMEQSGALASLADGILVRAAASAGSDQVRNTATVGGNLANASPAADMALPLLVLDAVAILQRQAHIPLEVPLPHFFLAPHKTVIGSELLQEVRIPPLPRGRGAWAFHKMQPIGGTLAIINVAAGVGLNDRGQCRWARIAIGSAAPVPMRAAHAERMLEGKALDDSAIAAAAEMVSHEISPQTDCRATAEYRREMSRVLVTRAIRECIERLQAY